MTTLEKESNEVLNIAIYLQLMSFLLPNTNSKEIHEIISSTHKFIKESSKNDLVLKLPEMKRILNLMTENFTKKFPLKKSINEIAYNWNDFFKDGKNPLSTGITYGWLEQHMDVTKLYNYNYVPFHYKVGLYAHAGYGGVEEDVLLKDAFITLVKANNHYELLNEYGKYIKSSNQEIDNDMYIKIADLKFEICSYSRLTIVSFYAFIECFVSSIGFSYLQRNTNNLSDEEKMTLKGLKKNNGNMPLKYKIEKYQKIIRQDNKAKIVVSDTKQLKEPFISFFNKYEELRNSAVHFSPIKKEPIWLKPEEWVENANTFSKLSIQVGLEFWKSCYEEYDSPDYLGRFNFNDLYQISKDKIESTDKIKLEINKLVN